MTILCGSDLSPSSGDALDVALALAVQRGEPEIVLLHVVDPTGQEDAVEPTLATARARLAAMVSTRGASPSIRTEVRVGPPDQTLTAVAELEGCDLIVIAAGSSKAGGSLLTLGTTAQRVIAHTTVPVIVVRDPAPWLAFARGEKPLRILLGVDESATCDLGISWLHALRRRAEVDIVLGAIYYPDDAASRYGVEAKPLVDRDPELERMIARDLLRRFGEGGLGELIAHPKLGLGRIGDHLLELAREEKVHAIVVGTGQKTGLGRLGSVSSIIVHDATQSVVCIPPSTAIARMLVPVLRVALVATDLSPFANRAVPYAFAVTPHDGEIHIVHVVKDDDEDVNEPELRATLRALVPPPVEGHEEQRVVTHVIRGDDPAIAVAQIAARLGVDVICIASHGRTGISRALVGSVADRLLRATRLPVLVLRPG